MLFKAKSQTGRDSLGSSNGRNVLQLTQLLPSFALLMKVHQTVKSVATRRHSPAKGCNLRCVRRQLTQFEGKVILTLLPEYSKVASVILEIPSPTP
jgi:hypothetical protein